MKPTQSIGQIVVTSIRSRSKYLTNSNNNEKSIDERRSVFCKNELALAEENAGQQEYRSYHEHPTSNCMDKIAETIWSSKERQPKLRRQSLPGWKPTQRNSLFRLVTASVRRSRVPTKFVSSAWFDDPGYRRPRNAPVGSSGRASELHWRYHVRPS